MGYNILDLIDKGIDIAIRKKNVYENIANEQSNISSIKILSKVLIKEADKSIEYYKKLRKEISSADLDEIGFDVYDKMAFLINAFNKRIYIPKVKNTKEYLKYSLALEKDLYSLLIDVQGRFVKSANDTATKTYKILTEIANHKIKEIKAIEDTLK